MQDNKLAIENIIRSLGLDRRDFEIGSKEIWPSELAVKNKELLNRNRIDMLEIDEHLKKQGFKSVVESHFSGKVNCINIGK